MKKIVYLFSAFVCTMMFCACASEESSNAGSGSKTVELYATGELSNSLKTYLGDNNTVLWSNGDSISVFTTEQQNIEFKLKERTNGNANATFTAEVQYDPAYALYPYQDNATCTEDGVITFILPAEQTYAENSFGNKNNISVGKIDGTDVIFKNTLGLLKFQLKHADDAPDFTISKIVVKDSTEGAKINGEFKVDANEANYAVPTENNEGTDEITLITDGVTITNVTKPFYVALPQGALKDGLRVTVYGGADGTTVLKEFKTKVSNTINRAQIKVMPASQIEFNDIFVEVEYLESTESQYIKTGVTCSSNLSVSCECEFNYPSSNLDENDRYNTWGCDDGNNNYYCPFHLAPSQKLKPKNYVWYVSCVSGIADVHEYTENVANTKFSVSVDLKQDVSYKVGSQTFTGTLQYAKIPNLEIYMFCINKAGNPTYNLRGKIYSMQMSNGNTPVRNFVPGRLKTGGACMYDTVNKKLYFNAAEGDDFNVGEDVTE